MRTSWTCGQRADLGTRSRRPPRTTRIDHAFEVAEQGSHGTFESLGCFADDGTRISREALSAAIGPLPSTDEFMAATCPPGSPERAARPDRWVVRLLHLVERRAAALAAERAELVGLLAADLPLPEAVACGRAVDAWARQLRDGGDDRPIGQLRAEVLRDLVLRPWAPAPGDRRLARGARRPVHAGRRGRAGRDRRARRERRPVPRAPRGGRRTRAAAPRRRVAGVHRARRGRSAGRRGHPAGGRARRPRSRAAPSGGHHALPPPRRPAQVRDRRCRRPHCTRRVGRTDLDHCTPWPRGATGCDDLCCVCRRHHRLETHAPAGGSGCCPVAGSR